ncbi:MAG: alpha/beta hydrolase family protein [Lachnospiraceae bacterium]|nr:alpha/beta hydrolase family protein [Lachnospiraceae bacterium]
MALMQVDFHSKTLQMEASLSVIMPEKQQGVGVTPFLREGRHPVLYLLHGTSGDHTDWERWTSIERYASKKGIAMVMPGAQLSAYANMVYGERFFDYIAEELPEFMKAYFPISDRREDTFICGLSMGGYGALKIGLSKPEQYAAIGTLSNGNHAYMLEGVPKELLESPAGEQLFKRFKLCWGLERGETPIGTEQDIFYLAERNRTKGQVLPEIFAACGTEDHNYKMASQMRDFFLGLPGNPYHYTYHEESGGHTWEFWDKWIVAYLEWLPIHL